MKSAFDYFLLSLVFSLVSPVLMAQKDSTLLDKHFKFRDGLYRSFSEMQQNQPSVSWDQVRAGLYSNPQTYITKVDYLKLVIEDSLVAMSPDSIYGFSLGGVPYLYVGRSDRDRFALFAGLQVRGHLCYFAFEKMEQVTYDMPVYNPLTGKPFRMGKVNRQERRIIEKLLIFPSGQVFDFTLENFKSQIKNDGELFQALEVLPPDEAFDKMWKCMLIYDDRHPVFIPGK